MKVTEDAAGLIIPLAALSIPVIAILSPMLSALIPLAYLVGGIGALTLAARYLMELRHRQRLEELDRTLELEKVQSERLAEAERLIALDDQIESRRALGERPAA